MIDQEILLEIKKVSELNFQVELLKVFSQKDKMAGLFQIDLVNTRRKL